MPNDTRSTQFIASRPDHPGILLPPPLIPLAMLIASIGLQQLAPLGWLYAVPSGLRIVAGVVLILAGLSAIVSARSAFVRQQTNVNPYRPSVAIVTDGIYARTRNPIYVGGVTLTIGVALIFALDWLLLLHLFGLPLLHYGVVLPEERYLGHKFGDAYNVYKSVVRRYV